MFELDAVENYKRNLDRLQWPAFKYPALLSENAESSLGSAALRGRNEAIAPCHLASGQTHVYVEHKICSSIVLADLTVQMSTPFNPNYAETLAHERVFIKHHITYNKMLNFPRWTKGLSMS